MSGKKTLLLICLLMLVVTVPAYADDCNSLRYVSNGNGTITDCRTGLIWLRDANCTDSFGGINKTTGQLSWYNAMKWVANLRDTGVPTDSCALSDGSSAGDWRLPTKTELMAMIESAKSKGYTAPALTNAAGTMQWTNGNAFFYVQSLGYWSSTTGAGGTGSAWGVDMWGGYVDYYGKAGYYYVWPVRGGQSGTFGNLIIE
jgi:hypothetical protein